MFHQQITEAIIEQKYAEFQQLQQQAEQLQQQAHLMQEQIIELDTSLDGLRELEKTALATEILAPLANGIFVTASLTENKHVLVNVGADTVVEKPVPAARQLLEDQKRELLEQFVALQTVQAEFEQQAVKAYKEVEKHVRQAERKA
ncbi:MAG: prefoldin subunit alpha [Nanoarchaeota archaeon]|nr:prefoldin subunit alpha [Nanoarchaeota archaeon]